ncbi:MAG: MBL fold metallo-hydrolase [Leeuwenhoekiella sp.]
MKHQAPDFNDVEVTLIGTGGGYGETIILKIGLSKWIIIDSCINPHTREPIALEYLESINVDLGNVILIICTHWHNDHIKGLSRLLIKCPNTDFCFSAVNDLDKFLLLCELDNTKASKGSKSSTGEFSKCLEIINQRERFFIRAQCDLLLEKLQENNCCFELFALSPSPRTLKNFDSEISELITKFGTRNTAIIKRSPNEKSVALLLRFNQHRVILGADLEIGRNVDEGWQHIIHQSKIIDRYRANLYKIPHHGSENGYSEDIFSKLVDKNSILKITPFKSSRIPTSEMLYKYSQHSPHIYLTSPIDISKKAKKRDRTISKIIDRTTLNISEIKFSQGIVRSRLNYLNPKAVWSTEVFEAGFKL